MLVIVPSGTGLVKTCDMAMGHYILSHAIVEVPEGAAAKDRARIFLNPEVVVAVAVIVFVPAETPTASELTVS